MPAMEIITGRAVNPGATLTAVTFGTGDSGAVRNFDTGAARGYLRNMWAQEATAGTVRIRSPRIHDNVQGIRARVVAADPRPLLPYPLAQPLYPQDVLTLEIAGGAAETDVMSALIYYDNVPGVNARLATWDQISPRIVNLVTVETNHTTGATAGDYGGSLAINANFDLLKANTDYAILGYETDVSVCSVGYRSPDFGNLRIGGPGTSQRDETRMWFTWLDQQFAPPAIPIFNAANKGGTFVDLVATQTATAVNVNTVLAELRTA